MSTLKITLGTKTGHPLEKLQPQDKVCAHGPYKAERIDKFPRRLCIRLGLHVNGNV